MNAKQCDRCKKYFIDYKEFDGYVRLTIASKSASRYQVKQDLCQECEQSLIEWFKEGNDDRKNDNQKDSRNKNEQSDEKKKITVLMTRDKFGKSLSLADEEGELMLSIPLEPIEDDLKKILEE